MMNIALKVFKVRYKDTKVTFIRKDVQFLLVLTLLTLNWYFLAG